MKLAIEGITNPALGPSLEKKSGQAFLEGFLPAVIGLGFLIGLVIFVFSMFIGAIKWLSSGGDKQGIEDARKTIGNALMGVVILLSIFALIKVIENFFGVNILSIDIGSFQVK